MEPRVLDINRVFSGMEKMLRRLIEEDVELRWLPAADLPTIMADPGQIEQVIMNLAVNARDAMPQGGQLTVETSAVMLDAAYAAEHLDVTPGPHVLLAVSDTGVGMDEATQAHIFEPFFTTRAVGKGTGLGLATVFGIVRQSGGTIWVNSKLGVGTTFKVYFPALEGVGRAKSSAPPSELPTLHGSETILLVEDDAQVRALTRAILRKYGYHVLVAASGDEALRLCEQVGPIHLLLTDVVMPHMSGRELAERVLGLRPELKVLCMSGYTDEAVVRHGIVAGTIAFMRKPITPEALGRKVREVLGAAAATSG
jgi:CheY-like chemotaxis protein